jgi:nicotinamide-nucleotide amidase
LNDLPEQQIGEWLNKKNLKLSVAESCTGGLIGDRITDIAGSSEYFIGGVIVYSYEAKEQLLGVSHQTLMQHGAVSEPTVLEMARGARQIFKARFPLESILGLSVSGIAGPGGGMPGKPVGLVWIGLSTPEGDSAYQYHWQGTRPQNKAHSADAALRLVLDYLHPQGLTQGAQRISVEVYPVTAGGWQVTQFSLHGQVQQVLSTGRRWEDDLGEHLLVTTAGGTCELIYSVAQGCWFYKPIFPPGNRV